VPLSLCPKVKLQVPPLRCAPVGMTKWGGRRPTSAAVKGDGQSQPIYSLTSTALRNRRLTSRARIGVS
jgi:hypothetical protein